MSVRTGFITLALATLGGAAALAAQQSVVFGMYGGGYTHLANLNSAGNADFDHGFNLGATLGYQFNPYLGVHSDVEFARNTAQGASSFRGVNFDRYFVGAHVELRFPSGPLTPFAFAGAGALMVDPKSVTSFNSFTKVAGSLGVGAAYTIPSAPVDVFFEAKTLTYKWDRGGFDRQMWDLNYALGFSYRWSW